MQRKALLFGDNKSNKFWWTAYEGLQLVVNYGKVGAIGRYQIKDFPTAEECEKEAKKLIIQKTKKGYLEYADFDFDNHLYFDDEEYGLHPLTSHPNFSSHFKNEFYYDCVDEETPFGSDEGSDTLAELQDIVRKNKDVDFVGFPKYLIEKVWDMVYIAVKDIDESAVRELLKSDEMNLIQSDMITYATAFAQIKITGFVDNELKDNAILAMQRMEIVSRIQEFENSEISETMIKDLSSFNKIRE